MSLLFYPATRWGYWILKARKTVLSSDKSTYGFHSIKLVKKTLVLFCFPQWGTFPLLAGAVIHGIVDHAKLPFRQVHANFIERRDIEFGWIWSLVLTCLATKALAFSDSNGCNSKAHPGSSHATKLIRILKDKLCLFTVKSKTVEKTCQLSEDETALIASHPGCWDSSSVQGFCLCPHLVLQSVVVFFEFLVKRIVRVMANRAVVQLGHGEHSSEIEWVSEAAQQNQQTPRIKALCRGWGLGL